MDGTATEIVLNGYLDIGIKDTMKDLLVNFIGAGVFSVMGLLLYKASRQQPQQQIYLPFSAYQNAQ